MSDKNTHIRDAFDGDAIESAVRDRLWNNMQHRQARQARARLLVRAGLVLLAGALLAAWAFLRSSPDSFGPIAVNADSISTDHPMEHSMMQNQEVPSGVIPLLGHRSSLTMDIQRLETRQLELANVLKGATGVEREVASNQLKSVGDQLEAARNALRVVDAQLAGQPVEVHAAVPPMPPEPPQIIEVHGGGGGIPDEVLYTAGGLGTLLVLAMFAMMGYMRRVSRTMREALTSIEQQVSSQHATLASGIDAIAVEVERLGEGQRFMSKVLSGSEAKAVPVHRQ